MENNHNLILKISRLEGLTDGVFAIAMTILALDLRLPTDVHHLASILTSVTLPKLMVYAGSFIILGTLWVAMNFQMGLLAKINRPYLWTHIFYLMTICVVPFSASLVAAYPNNSLSISVYAVNLLAASFAQLFISQCSNSFKLNRDIYTEAIRKAIMKRILVAPIFYVASLTLAYWHPGFSFVLLVLPTLIYILPGKIDRYDP